jgi:hypothetical protein
VPLPSYFYVGYAKHKNSLKRFQRALPFESRNLDDV